MRATSSPRNLVAEAVWEGRELQDRRAFALVDASVASLFFFAQPLVGAVLSSVILQQPFTPGLLVGSILIATGVLLALRE